MRRFLLLLITLAMLGIGCSGKDGATGPTGPKGDKGDTGDIGPQGPPGTAARTVYFTNGTIASDNPESYNLTEVLLTDTPAVMAYVSFNGTTTWGALPVKFISKNGESSFTLDNGIITFYNCGGLYGMIVIVE